jgi:hypothetical protein
MKKVSFCMKLASSFRSSKPNFVQLWMSSMILSTIHHNNNLGVNIATWIGAYHGNTTRHTRHTRDTHGTHNDVVAAPFLGAVSLVLGFGDALGAGLVRQGLLLAVQLDELLEERLGLDEESVEVEEVRLVVLV